MIELSAQAIFLQDSHGYAVPFDPDDLAARIRSVLPGNGAESDALARDAVSAVEYALRHAGKPKSGPLYVKASAVDAMIANILRDPKKTKAVKPADFNPYNVKPKAKAPVSILRDIWCKETKHEHGNRGSKSGKSLCGNPARSDES